MNKRPESWEAERQGLTDKVTRGLNLEFSKIHVLNIYSSACGIIEEQEELLHGAQLAGIVP